VWDGERDNFWGKIVKKIIDLSVYSNWVPIDNCAVDEDNWFAGKFDGNGKVISKLTINRPDKHYQGLFGRIYDSSTAKNVGIDGADIKGYSYVGAVAGYVENGCVDGCYSTGKVNGCYSVGGIAGYVEKSSIINCYSAITANGIERAGGVMGYCCDTSSVIEDIPEEALIAVLAVGDCNRGTAPEGLVPKPGRSLAVFMEKTAAETMETLDEVPLSMYDKRRLRLGKNGPVLQFQDEIKIVTISTAKELEF